MATSPPTFAIGSHPLGGIEIQYQWDTFQTLQVVDKNLWQ